MAQSILAKMAVEISANTAKFNEGVNKSIAQSKKFESSLKSLRNQMLAGFGVLEIGRQMIDVTAEFERFEALLTQTLGSNSDAQYALQSIRDFAVRTPFEVNELTSAYVKWVNQGLNPTISKMQMLGDIASITGKGFEQTAEAFKDLLVGQTKRIEELGIVATQANGKIQLSYRGVNIEVEKTIQGVDQALIAFANAPGVLGSTEAIAKTLGGQLSNLKDAFSNFLLTIGQSSGGLICSFVTPLTSLLTALSNLGSVLDIVGSKLTPWRDVNDLSKETLDYALKLGRTEMGTPIADVIRSIEGNRTAVEQYAAVLDGSREVQRKFREEFEKQGETVDSNNRLWYAYMRDLTKRAEMEGKQAEAAKKASEDAKKTAEDAAKAQQAELARAEAKKKAQQEYNDKLKEEAEAWKDLMKARSMSFEDLKKQYKEQPQMQQVAPVTPMSVAGQIQAPDLSNYVASLEPAIAATDRLRIAQESLNESFMASASQGLTEFFTGLGDVANRQVSFGDNFLKAVAGFMKQFGNQLIALGVAKLGLDNLFKTGLGGPAAIAAGVALVAAAGAISKSLSQKSQNVGTGGGAGTGFSQQTVTATGQTGNIQISGKLVGSGRDLVAVINNTSFDNSQRKGG